MRPRRFALLAAAALAALAAPRTAASPLAAGKVGATLPAVQLEGFSQTKAASYDDLLGRTVLLEFFAYW